MLMERTKNLYEAFFDSIFGGRRHAYFIADNKEQVEKGLHLSRQKTINYIGKVDYYASEDEVRRQFGLSSDDEFLTT